MNGLPPDVNAALLAVHRILVRLRWMVGEGDFDTKVLFDVLDHVEVLPMRILDGELTTCFAEIEGLAQTYPDFRVVWEELERSIPCEPAADGD